MTLRDLPITPTLVIPGRELTWSAVRSSGPGGQNVNKVASKIDLRFAFRESAALPKAVQDRLACLYRNRLDPEGRLIVTSEEERSQSANLERARQKLVTMVRAVLAPPRPRRPTAPSRAARVRRMGAKRAIGEKKAYRGRVYDD